MSKSFIHQHIKNIKKQQDISAASVSVKTPSIIPIIVNPDNITSSNLPIVIKEIAEAERLRLEQSKLEQEAAEQERIRKAEEHKKQEEARLLREIEEQRLLELEKKRLEQTRRLEEERIIKEQLAAQKLEEQRLTILEQQRLLREAQERLAKETEEQRIKTEQARIAMEQERLELEKQRLEQIKEIEEKAKIPQEKITKEQQVIEVTPIIATKETHQDIEELLPTIAEIQINEQEAIDNQKILISPIQKEPESQLLFSLHIEDQPTETIFFPSLPQQEQQIIEQLEESLHIEEQLKETEVNVVQLEQLNQTQVNTPINSIIQFETEEEEEAQLDCDYVFIGGELTEEYQTKILGSNLDELISNNEFSGV